MAHRRRHRGRLSDRAPRIRPAHRPRPRRPGATLPGARSRTARAGAASAAAAVFQPRQLPAAVGGVHGGRLAPRVAGQSRSDWPTMAGRSLRERPTVAGAGGTAGPMRRPGVGRPASPVTGPHPDRARSAGGAGGVVLPERRPLRDAARRAAGGGWHADGRRAPRGVRHPVAEKRVTGPSRATKGDGSAYHGAGARPGGAARAGGGAGRSHRPAAAGDRRAGGPIGRPARADRPAAAAA